MRTRKNFVPEARQTRQDGMELNVLQLQVKTEKIEKKRSWTKFNIHFPRIPMVGRASERVMKADGSLNAA